MQKAQFIALLRYLLNRTVLPHPVKGLNIFHELSTSAFPFPPLPFILFKTYFSHRDNVSHTAVRVALARAGKGSTWWHQQMCLELLCLGKAMPTPRDFHSISTVLLHSGQPGQAPERCPPSPSAPFRLAEPQLECCRPPGASAFGTGFFPFFPRRYGAEMLVKCWGEGEARKRIW